MNDNPVLMRGQGKRRCRLGAKRMLTGLALAGLLGGTIHAEAAALDINRASTAELEALPGIGAAKAAAIIEERQVRPFSSVDDLERVRGIGPALVAQLREHVTVASPQADKAQ
jgi:competence protein ComEA